MSVGVACGLLVACLLTCALADDGSHWVVLPDKIQEGKPVTLAFTFFNTTEDVEVQAVILYDDHHMISTARDVFQAGEPGMLILQVPAVLPDTSYNARYTVLMHGLQGLYFGDHAELTYDTGVISEHYSVQVQTDKSVYNPGQTVRFRSLIVGTDLMVYPRDMNISVYDPKGNKMKQIINASEPTYGVVEDYFIMDTEPILGSWYIDVQTKLGNTRKYFKVEKYVLPKFDVSIQLPSYVVTSDNEMHGTVQAKYTYGKPVIGKVLILADIDYSYSPWKYNGNEVMVETTVDIDGEAKFTIPFARFQHEVEPSTYKPFTEVLDGHHLIIKVMVTESLNNLTRNASSQVQFYKQPYALSFNREDSATFFKPGLPYTSHIRLTQADGRPVISSVKDVRVVSYVKYTDEHLHRDRAETLPELVFSPPPTGDLEVTIVPPPYAKSLHMEVYFKTLSTTFESSRPYWFLANGTIQLTANTSYANVGDELTFKAETIDAIQQLYFFVVAESRMVQSGSVNVAGSTESYVTVNVTAAMKPYAQLVVYYFTDTDWNADSLYFSVSDGSNSFRNQISMSFNKLEVEPGDAIELMINTDPASMVNLLAVDQSTLLMGVGHDITQSSVLKALSTDTDPPSQFSYKLHDPTEAMQTRGAQVLTDVDGFSWLRHYYKKRQLNCVPIGTGTGTGTGTGGGATLPLKQVQRTRDFFPETWLWTNVTSQADGTAVVSSKAPDTITSWVATAFSVNAKSGLGIIDTAAKMTTFRPFFVSLNLPYSIIRGEQVVLQANVFNYMHQDVDVVVTLSKSDDFAVIEQQAGGQFNYVYKDVLKNVHIKAGAAESVFFPIVAVKVGVADISVKAQSILSADGLKRQLIVEPEGTRMHLNIPQLLTTQGPISVTPSYPPNVVADSLKTQVIAMGDFMGPTLKNLKRLVRLPTGCGEQTMTNLAPDIYVYNYLQTANILTPALDTQIKEYMVKGYQRELGFQHTDGSFSIWGPRDYQGSSWLTAFVLKSFSQASEHIYVTERVLYRAATWLSNRARGDGSFPVVGSVHSTSLSGGASPLGYSHTAFVLIALVESQKSITTYAKTRINQRAANARAFLERKVNQISDVYDLAITSYALAKAGSPRAANAYNALLKQATNKDGKMYWRMEGGVSYHVDPWYTNYDRAKPLEIELASYALLYLIETNQYSAGYPILKWLLSQRNSLGGFRSTQDTVLGLQAMAAYRYASGAGLSLDINVAASNFSQLIHVDKTDAMVLKIVDVPSYAVTPLTTGGSSTSSPAPPPHISLSAIGSGSALVQISVSFNVEDDVIPPAFDVNHTISQETLRSLVMTTCARLAFPVGTNILSGECSPLVYNVRQKSAGTELCVGTGVERPRKHDLKPNVTNDEMAVIEIDVPTGFTPELESSLTVMKASRKVELKNEKTVIIYYDKIGAGDQPTCATLEMVRTDLVAKMKPATIRVYDYYNPDNQALDFYESQLLKDSSFCDVCPTCGCIGNG